MITSRQRILGRLRLLATAAAVAIAVAAVGLPGLRSPSPVLAASGGCTLSSSTCYLFDVSLGHGPGTGTGFGTYATVDENGGFTGRINCHYGNEQQTGTCGWGYELPSAGGEYTLVYKITPDPGSQVCDASTCHGTDVVNDYLTISGNYLESRWHFELIQHFQIEVASSGSGTGTVTSNPPGIACPGDCDDLFAANFPVVLTAKAKTGSVFAGWSGGGCSGTGTCVINSDFLQSVTAKFNKKATPAPATETPTEAPSEEITPEPTVDATPTAEPLPTATAEAVATALAITPIPTTAPSAPVASNGITAVVAVGLGLVLVVLVGGAMFFARRGSSAS